ncbi:MAG: MarR family transcriptional regulator [Thermoplasmata archaeon]
MRVLLTPFPGGPSAGTGSRNIEGHVREVLKDLGIQTGSLPADRGDLGEADFILVLGSDRDVLKAFQEYGDAEVPILGVNDATGSAFLTDISLDALEEGLRRVGQGQYGLEACQRLSVTVDETLLPAALNEVAVFPAKTATLMEYKLTIDGEEVYRDYSDGVLVATPTGSSAYALSAGGPLVLPQSRVFVVVSVNSMDVSRRPLVVSDQSILEFTDISARSDCEVIIDGLQRQRVEERVEIQGGRVGHLIRMNGGSTGRLEALRRVRSTEELMKMPPSAKLVLKAIEYEGPMTARDIAAKTLLPPRTVRHAVAILVENGLVARSPHLRDLRSDIFYLVAEDEEGEVRRAGAIAQAGKRRASGDS